MEVHIMNQYFQRWAFISLLTCLAACTQSFTDSEHIEKAGEHINKREFKAAEIELKNALQINQSNAEARLLLGQVYLDNGDNALGITRPTLYSMIDKLDLKE